MGYIRDNQIDSQHIVARECHTAVYYNNAVFIFEGSHIHTDLFQTTERYDLYLIMICFLFQSMHLQKFDF